MTEPPKKRGGRATKRDELLQFAEHAGMDLERVDEFLGAGLPAPDRTQDKPPPPKPVDEDAPPASWDEWEDELMKMLWRNRKDLRGIAMVQALKAIATLAEHQRQRELPDSQMEQVSILDRLDALPPEHAAQLLRDALARNEELAAQMRAALDELEAE